MSGCQGVSLRRRYICYRNDRQSVLTGAEGAAEIGGGGLGFDGVGIKTSTEVFLSPTTTCSSLPSCSEVGCVHGAGDATDGPGMWPFNPLILPEGGGISQMATFLIVPSLSQEVALRTTSRSKVGANHLETGWTQRLYSGTLTPDVWLCGVPDLIWVICVKDWGKKTHKSKSRAAPEGSYGCGCLRGRVSGLCRHFPTASQTSLHQRLQQCYCLRGFISPQVQLCILFFSPCACVRLS